MFKDYNKYLITSLKVYLFVLIIIVILKLLGLDYFGIDVNNHIICSMNEYLANTKWLLITKATFILALQFYFFLCIVCEKRKLYIQAIIGAIINIVAQIILMDNSQMHSLYFIVCALITIVMPMIIKKKIMFKRQIICIFLITLYQAISLLIRNISLHYEYGNFVVDNIMNLDQILMLAITYTLFFIKKEGLQCQELKVGSFLQMKANLLKLPKKLQENLHNFKKQSKENKLTIIIYLILSFIWNLLSLLMVLIVAQLNHTLIECLFILTSFWLSKKAFGKAFHLPSMSQCFIVSNITYYILNRITAPLGLSIIIPIMLGVGLSYTTSKLVRKVYKPLYKGMPKETFEETIIKVVDKNSDKYKICYEYYINKKSALALSMKYNYSEAGIRKICNRVNQSIKELK